jgi:hypothetical protein
MVQTFIYSAVMYGAEVWDTKAVKDKMSAVVKKALRSILALHPQTALLTFCRGHWATSTRCSLMLPNCVGSTDARTWRLADQGGAAILIRGWCRPACGHGLVR